MREPDSLLISPLCGLAGTMSFLPGLQNICFPAFPPLLAFQLSRALRGPLWRWVGTSLAAVRLPGWFYRPHPSLGTASARAGPPRASLPHPNPALCSCHIGRVQPLHSLRGSGFHRLFCEACTLVLQMSFRPSTLSSQVQPRPPPPFQEAVPNGAIILGTLVPLREAERRGGKRRERKPERGRGRDGKAEKGKGSERPGEDSASA